MFQVNKVTVKFQTGIPKQIRKKLNIKVDDYIEFKEEKERIILKKADKGMIKHS